MGAQTIKHDALRESRRVTRMLKHGRITTVSVAVDIHSKEILGIGVDHASVVKQLTGAPEGSWEILEYPVWR